MTSDLPLHILCLSGSLRTHSFNTSILAAFAALAPRTLHFSFYENLEQIPPFHPDRQERETAVDDWRHQLAMADGVIISTPEYAFGVPGVLKNALDWVVGTGEFNDKPVAAISASPLSSGGDKALGSLALTLTALGTQKNEHTLLSIPLIKKKLNAEGKLTDEETLKQLAGVLEHLLLLISSKLAHTSA